MSIIGHSIQSGIVNVHIAMKAQQAGQAAQTEEDARREASIRRAEELAREGIAETREAGRARVQNPPDRDKKEGREEGHPGQEEDRNKRHEPHIDLFA